MIPVATAMYGAISILTLTAGVALLIPGSLESSLRWRWWAAGISLTGTVFTLAVAIQQAAGPGNLNLYADRVSLIAIIALVPLVMGLTYAYWGLPYRRLIAIFGPLHLALAAITLFSDAVISPSFERREALPFFGGEYWEATVGPVQRLITIYLVLGAIAALVAWFIVRRGKRPGSPAFLVGFISWLVLGVNDAVSNLFYPTTPPALALGFLFFVIMLLMMAVEDSRTLRRRVRAADAQVAAIMTASPQPVIALDAEGTILFANEEFVRLTRLGTGSEWSELQDLLGHTDRERIDRAVQRVRSAMQVQTLDIGATTPDGEERQFSCIIAPVDRERGEETPVVVSLSDITERALAAARSEYLSIHDTLTGLMNRSALNQRLEELVDQSTRDPSSPSWAVLFLDLDEFKGINDTRGHAFGDEVLKQVSQRLRAVVPRADLCFRLGGDEFVIIVTGISDAMQALDVASEVDRKLREPMEIEGSTVQVRASVGVTVHPAGGGSVTDVLRSADLAMYEAKSSDEQIRFFTDAINNRAMQRLHLENDLEHALERNEFTIEYQHTVDSKRSVRLLNARVRWQHPEQGVLPLETFVSIATRSRELAAIGTWALRTLFRDRAALTTRYPHATAAVRMFAIQLRHPSIIEEIESLVNDASIDPTAIAIEIDQSELARDRELLMSRIDALRTIGFSLVLGGHALVHTSLMELPSLPFTTVKFDCATLFQSAPMQEAIRVFEGVHAIVRSLGMQTIVTGIERADQLELLQAVEGVWLEGDYLDRFERTDSGSSGQ